MTLLIVHHADDGDAGTLTDRLAGRGIETSATTTLDAGDAAGTDAILVVEGAGATLDAGEHAQRLSDGLAAAVEAEVPVLAVGPGAQSLAVALGGEVATRERPEAGLVALHRTEPGRSHDITAGWPDEAHALVLHADEVVRLPDGAEQLMLGSDGPTVWSFGSALAVGPRMDVDAEAARRWLAEDVGRSLAEGVELDPDSLLASIEERSAFLRATGLSLLLRWVDGLDL